MDGFVEIIRWLAESAGFPKDCVFTDKSQLHLPGFFRATKQWDVLVVKDEVLVAAIELKSQVGPSFGNNFNNRTEEAMGSALDLWTAFRDQAFGRTIRPWLGYLMLLEDCEASRRPVAVKEPHFEVFDEFRDASYISRYELFCRKLVLERHYDCTAFLTSSAVGGCNGAYREPNTDLGFDLFANSFTAHLGAFKGR